MVACQTGRKHIELNLSEKVIFVEIYLFLHVFNLEKYE